jgi:hypothetical protein
MRESRSYEPAQNWEVDALRKELDRCHSRLERLEGRINHFYIERLENLGFFLWVVALSTVIATYVIILAKHH